MIRLQTSSVALLLLAGVAVAQDLQIAGFEGSSLPASPVWALQTLEVHDHATLLCTAPRAATHVLLFAHTTVDDTAETVPLRLLYPFLCPPVDQTLATVRDQMASSIAWDNPGQALAVPATRVRMHLQAFLASGNRPSFGPVMGTTATRFTGDPLVWQSAGRTDERRSWSEPWFESNQVFNVSAVGREALRVAAYAALAEGQMELSGLDALDSVMRSEFGYRIHIQALFVSFDGGVRVRASQSVVAHRACLRELGLFGPIQAFPSVFNADHWVYAAQRGGIAHVMFPHSVQGLTAFFETTSGWVQSAQIPNPLGAEPERARFAYPADAVSGFAYFMMVPVLGGAPVFVNPLHAYGVATPQNPVLPASMFAFE